MLRLNGTRVDRSRFALLAALGIDNFGSGLFLPLALLYATRVVDLDVEVAGTLVAVAGAAGFAVPPVAGRLTHRFGPAFVVAAAQLVQGVGALIYLVSANGLGVFAAAGLMAVGTQLFYCSVFVLIADVSTNESKERPFALVAMVRSASFGLGTLTAGLTLLRDDDTALRVLVGVDALTFVVAAALLAAFVSTRPVAVTTSVGSWAVLRDPGYRALIVAVSLVGLAVDVALIGTPVFLLDILDAPPWLPGALLAGGAVLSSVYGVAVVDAVGRFRRTRVLQTGAWIYAGWALLTGAMLWLPTGWLVPYGAVTWVLFVASSKAFYPVSAALSEGLPPREDRAAYMATYQYAFTAAQVLAPGVVALFAVTDWLPWLVVAACSVLGVAVMSWLSRRIPAAVDAARRPTVTTP